MYSLVLIVAGAINTVGAYSTVEECRTDATQFKDTKVVVACVRQQDPREQMDRIQYIMQNMMRSMENAK